MKQFLNSPRLIFNCVAFSLGLIGDCLNIFQSIYLVLIGWNEGSVGLALSLMGFAALSFQTISGDMIDKTTYDRRKVLSIACIVTTLCALAIIFVNDNSYSQHGLYYITKIIQGIASTFIMPTISALTMGWFGPKYFDLNMASIILYSHVGTLVTAVLAGLSAYLLYPNIHYSFLVLGFALVLALIFIRVLPKGDAAMGRGFHGTNENYTFDCQGNAIIDDGTKNANDTGSNNDEVFVHSTSKDKTAPLNDSTTTNNTNTSSKEQEAASYWTIFTDSKICILSLTGLFFHFANANVLLVLGELMSNNNDDGTIKRTAFPLIAGAITIAQISMAITTKFCNVVTHEYNIGRKILFLVGLLSLPIRCFLLILWKDSGDYYLMSTQILDGIGGGFFGILHPYLVADITYGTGRFNVAMGLTGTCFGIGASLSNFLGQLVVQHFGHTSSLYGSLLLSFVPIVLFGIFMPETLGLRGKIGDEIASKKRKENSAENETTGSATPYVNISEVQIV